MPACRFETVTPSFRHWCPWRYSTVLLCTGAWNLLPTAKLTRSTVTFLCDGESDYGRRKDCDPVVCGLHTPAAIRGIRGLTSASIVDAEKCRRVRCDVPTVGDRQRDRPDRAVASHCRPSHPGVTRGQAAGQRVREIAGAWKGWTSSFDKWIEV